MERALADARATRQRIDAELRSGRFARTGQSAPPDAADGAPHQGISLRRAELLVNRVSVARLYSQSGVGGSLGGELGQRIDTAGSAAQQEIDQIVQRAQRSQQG